jgi:hypothetical protein
MSYHSSLVITKGSNKNGEELTLCTCAKLVSRVTSSLLCFPALADIMHLEGRLEALILQIKTTLRFYFSLLRKAIIKKTNCNTCW